MDRMDQPGANPGRRRPPETAREDEIQNQPTARRRTQAARLAGQTQEEPIPRRDAPYARPVASRPVEGTPGAQHRLYIEEPDDEIELAGTTIEYDPLSDDDIEEELGKKRHPLRWVIILLLVLALLAGATYIGTTQPALVEDVVQWGRGIFSPATPSPEPTVAPTPTPAPTPPPPPSVTTAVVVSFMAEPETQPNIELPILFRVTTSLQTDRVQLVDGNGRLLMEGVEGDYTDSEAGRNWLLMYYFTEPYEGAIEISPGNVSGWNDAGGASLYVKIGEIEAQPSGEPAPAPVSTAEISPVEGGGATATNATPMATIQIRSEVYDKNEIVEGYLTPSVVSFDADYTRLKGVTAYRDNALRQNAAFGDLGEAAGELEIAWTYTKEMEIDRQTQPLIVQWDANIRELMPMLNGKNGVKALKEVIFGATDGNIHFLDLADGQPTREALNVGAAVGGTLAIHPKGLPLVMVGTADTPEQAASGEAGMYAYDLLQHRKRCFISGVNALAYSADARFLGSPIIDMESDTALFTGNNGLLYALTLNTTIDTEAKKVTLESPSLAVYRTMDEQAALSTNTGVAASGGFVYFINDEGWLQCVDANALSPVWAVALGAKADATLALEDSGNATALYAATTGEAAFLRKLDAATGALLWEQEIACAPGEAPIGAIASPVVGEGALSEYVYFTVTVSGSDATIYALSKETGEIIWHLPMGAYTVSSPIALYGAEKAFIAQGDADGVLRLLDGLTGDLVTALQLEGAIDGSPAAYDEMLVVGTREGNVYGIRVK